MSVSLSGGCQCGAVRFRVEGTPGDSSICYCRMCQKASAAFALALVNTSGAKLTWTRGKPAWFASSNKARRGFCAECGTPLAYDAPDGLALSTLAFDDPDVLPPTVAWGVEAKRPWCDAVVDLPEHVTMEDSGASFLSDIVSRQHPDHDTGRWPPEDGQ
ncbi:MAG: GFA family protein [Pseudomonadota bacterium]|nr:GFA family protein [Pseudomonadota bacterium]